MQTFTHYFLHFGAPLWVAIVFFRQNWLQVYLIFLATMIVDVDHLLASPIFQADRCSINFHPLHTYWAIGGYVIMLFLRKPWNLIGLGLCMHMLTDFIDCLFIQYLLDGTRTI